MIEASRMEEEIIPISSFDGQVVRGIDRTSLFEVGNFLGGGAAGTVYECENVKTQEHFALKILNPLGYKLINPTLLRRCSIILKGKSVSEDIEKSNALLKEHVWWLLNGSTKQFVAGFHSEKHNCLKELSLSQCIRLWGLHPQGVGEDDTGEGDATTEIIQTNGERRDRLLIPVVPPKYCDFVRRRNRIFREIRNMRKISTHVNVIRLEGVLEYTEDSKCTIFLVMELANGGELFDRIKIDCGTREETAKFFFQQLLEGVKHCHQQGVCHRDLKPENLLLQDSPGGTVLKIADFGFSARFVFGMDDNDHRGDKLLSNQSTNRIEDGWKDRQNQMIYTVLTPPAKSPSLSSESPLRVLKSVVGSPFYVAPEVLQAHARGYDGPKADIYSLGVILYAMLAGNLPFEQELSTCKRFRLFCKWVREQTSKGVRFENNPNIEYPPWLFPAKFSTGAKGLIVSMLHPDPDCRITVLEAMQHPLLRSATSVTNNEQEQQGSQAVSEPKSNMNMTPTHTAQVDSSERVLTSHGGVILEQACNKFNDQEATKAVVIDNNMDMDIDNTENQQQQAMNRDNSSISLDNYGEDSYRSDNYRTNSAMDDDDDEGNLFQMEEDDDVAQHVGRNNSSATPHWSSQQPPQHPQAVQKQHQATQQENRAVPSPLIASATKPLPIQHSTAVPQTTVFASSPFTTSFYGSSPNASGKLPPLAPPMLHTPDMTDLITNDDDLDVDKHSSGGGGSADGYRNMRQRSDGDTTSSDYNMTSPSATLHPPHFSDLVKRSTRFITAVPAQEVLDKVEQILEHFRFHRETTPIGHIGKIEVCWESFRLEVWGSDTSGLPLCALQVYTVVSSATASPQHPASFSSSYEASIGGFMGPQNLYMVEFIRGQLEIFAFKRFYQLLRQRISELVKRDYAFKGFDQQSPVVDSFLRQQYELSRS